MPVASGTTASSSADAGSDAPAGSSGGTLVEARIDPSESAVLEQRTRAIGRELFERIGRGPKPWHRAWWEGRFIAATLDDPLVRVQLFRFIDVLPALTGSESVRRHLAEYLAEAGDRVPIWLRLALRLAPAGSVRADWLAHAARAAAGVMATKFIAGATPDEALRTVMELRRGRLAFTADLLGEEVISDVEADLYQETCLALIRSVKAPLESAPEIPLIDRDQFGPIPRTNLSLKLSSLTAEFEPIHAESSIERVAGRLRPILRAARAGSLHPRRYGAVLHPRSATSCFAAYSASPSFATGRMSGSSCRHTTRMRSPSCACCSNGSSAAAHRSRSVWSRERTGISRFRRLAGWVGLSQSIFRSGKATRRLSGAHGSCSSTTSICAPPSAATTFAASHTRSPRPRVSGFRNPPTKCKPSTAWATRSSAHSSPAATGCGVYTPYGAVLPGMAYLVRRLLENTSNDSFLKMSLGERSAIDGLLRDPEEIGAMLAKTRRPKTDVTASAGAAELVPFRNEPPTDFARASNRDAMRRALEQVRSQLGRNYPLWIDGREAGAGSRWLDSLDPSHSSRVVGRVALAAVDDVELAVAAARRAFPAWAATPVRERAGVLIKAAAIMRNRRFELAAWEVYECGKPWAEADADVAEAIDFCEFYAREMIRLSQPRHRDTSGETNFTEHLPRGVTVVIPPWNFPLAIPTGMTVAALVAGNTTILKPAEQSSVIAWQLVRGAGRSRAAAGCDRLSPRRG